MFNYDLLGGGIDLIKELSVLARVLSDKYDVVITNPPYIGISSMEPFVKDYAAMHYPNSKADMLTMFMETELSKANGFVAMVNMHSWMFLSSFELLREELLRTKTIVTMAHLGARAFDSIGGEIVQTTAFVLRNGYCERYIGQYARLVDETSEKEKERAFLNKNNTYQTAQEDYSVIHGSPCAYWVNDRILELFSHGEKLSEFVETKDGLTTSNNEKYIRFFWEVALKRIGFGAKNENDFWGLGKRFAPLIKGGLYRKWYGNTWFVITFSERDRDILSTVGNHLPSEEVYFFPYLTWNRISTRMGFRYCNSGFLFESASLIATGNNENIMFALGFANSSLAKYEMEIINPTTNMLTGYVNQLRIPRLRENEKKSIIDAVRECVRIAKCDWDSSETSWDFEEHPFVRWSKSIWDATAIGATMHYFYGNHPKVNSSLELCFLLWQGECKERFCQVKEKEEEINRIFAEACELWNEIPCKVDDNNITVRLADKERDVRSFVSYLVGLAMGRYSLLSTGIAYAGGPWDDARFGTEQPDDDGIIPIYKNLGMEDGLVTKLKHLIKYIFGEDSYRGNIDFIAEALGKNGNESSEETLNRYLNDGFYADHLKVYQKRPIYWLFTSGKKEGFKCLVYMHRYNEDTLARINAKYFLPETTRKKNELEELSAKAKVAEGREGIRLEKARQNLAAAYNEAIEYGQVLDHMANQYIKIDLDDGVKVNYAKFQGIEIVTDAGSKVKKDLLAPIG